MEHLNLTPQSPHLRMYNGKIDVSNLAERVNANKYLNTIQLHRVHVTPGNACNSLMCQRITSLIFNNCILEDGSFECVIRSFPNLTSLTISETTLNCGDFKYISNLKNIQQLKIEFIFECNTQFLNTMNSNLHSLLFCGIQKISFDTVPFPFKNKLKILELPKSCTIEQMEKILSTLWSLETLTLDFESFQNIGQPEAQIHKVINTLPRSNLLKNLHIQNITDSQLAAVKQFKNLQPL